MQRFGCVARSPDTSAIMVLLVPKDYFKETHCLQEEKTRKAVETRKHRADALANSTTGQPKKQAHHKTSPSLANVTNWPTQIDKDKLNNQLLSLFTPKPDQPTKDYIWPSSDFEIPEDVVMDDTNCFEYDLGRNIKIEPPCIQEDKEMCHNSESDENTTICVCMASSSYQSSIEQESTAEQQWPT